MNVGTHMATYIRHIRAYSTHANNVSMKFDSSQFDFESSIRLSDKKSKAQVENEMGNISKQKRLKESDTAFNSKPKPLVSFASSPFRLRQSFIEKYENAKAPFGFNGLGELVYHRTYSRPMQNGRNERWPDTVKRVVEGAFSMKKGWTESRGLGWNEVEMQKQAEEMYSRIFNFKFLPPGRGLWAMGSSLTEERGLYAALNNCAFVSTRIDFKSGMKVSKPFCFLMDASMLGVGVGFDTEMAKQDLIALEPEKSTPKIFVVPDSREGWVKAVELLIDSYFDHGSSAVEFDFSKIRPKGSPIKGFGGIASGSEVLETLLSSIRGILNHLAEARSKMSIVTIVDIMNMIGKCVVAGNVRRTAEIAFGPPQNSEYLNLKNYTKNPQRVEYGWASNNSVYAELGMDYKDICDRIRDNGEPGLAWLGNMQRYGRMGDSPDEKDHRAMGGNPCLEQTLESYELCCLVETFPCNHESKEDFLKTLESAFLYAKIVTLGQTHWPETNQVMTRNRRIGCSMTGIAQFITRRGIDELKDWSEDGYKRIQACDAKYSEKFGVPRSIKTTSIKPSGTVSLLAGATPGMHYPESRYYIRRVRIPYHSDLIGPLRKAGYSIEEAVGQPDTAVVSFPVDAGEGIRTTEEVSMWEQLSLAAFLQRHWADNQVSCTVTFDPETEGDQIQHALQYFQYQLKGISFLPRLPSGAYPQMPYEAITNEEYEKALAQIGDLDFDSDLSKKNSEILMPPDLYCDSCNTK
eukprot:CAMPEP_0184478974 /NCGR_PEP_ID=MMETSP0113_2-20130426/856_1 /TAXON_ID=91329 /ORGANISM="Norrisiella sphaerica, Strain BC52" /LENGTH=745 /DNA_ID=CAMNT_0026856939 /DNA_START=105 /DNA_END=2342 /DNA_ORIENTATION=-